jgi:serine/threonine protein kinase
MKKGDIWSLGISLYNMTFNCFPYDSGSSELELMDNIQNFKLEFKSRRISEDLIELLSLMLEKDPNKRPSAQ